MPIEPVSIPPTPENFARGSANLQATEQFVNGETPATVDLPGGATVPNLQKIAADAQALIEQEIGDFTEAVQEVETAAAGVAGAVTQVEAARDSALSSRNIFADPADAISKGVLSFSGLVPGSGGTDGTFDLGLSGGGGTGAAARFVVAAGAVTDVILLNPGINYSSAPARSFSASPGLSGASVTAVIGSRTSPGQIFFALSDDSSEALRVYENVAGVVTPTGKVMIDGSAFFIAEQKPSKVMLARGANKRAALWLEDDKLGAIGAAPRLLADILANIPLKSVQGAEGGPSLMICGSNKRVVMVAEAGKKPKFFGDTPLAGGGGGAPADAAVLSTDGRAMFRWRAKMARKRLLGTGTGKVVITGSDSWGQQLAIPQALATLLQTEYGKSGVGWISMDSDRNAAVAPLDGVVFSKSGWTDYDMTDEGRSLDAFAIGASGTSATVSISALRATDLKIYYLDGTGSFRYRIDGGSWTSVIGGNTGNRAAVTVSGLADANHAIDIDLTGNSGTVIMYGVYATRAAAGVEVSKAGNGSARAYQWEALGTYVSPYLADIAPDVVIVILGTNDTTDGISQGAFKASLSSLLSNLQGGAPDAAYILVAPPSNGGTMLTAMSLYRDAMYEIAAASPQVEFFNLHDLFASYATMNAADLDMWADERHLNESAGRLIASEIHRHFLSVS